MKRFLSCLLALAVLLTLTSCKRRDTVSFDKQDTKMIAHRGLSGLEIENTAEAFEAAGKRSYFGIEADVRRTADGKFVICHDDNLDRLAGVDISVEETTLEELQKIPLLDKKGKKCNARLSDLETYIRICKQYDKEAILELKSSFTEEEIGRMVEIIRVLGHLERVTFISFGYGNLEKVRQILPNQSVMYLFSKLTPEITEQLIRDRIDAAIAYHALTRKALHTFHEAGLTVNCWTVDGKAIAASLASMGVDYITTNILE